MRDGLHFVAVSAVREGEARCLFPSRAREIGLRLRTSAVGEQASEIDSKRRWERQRERGRGGGKERETQRVAVAIFMFSTHPRLNQPQTLVRETRSVPGRLVRCDPAVCHATGKRPQRCLLAGVLVDRQQPLLLQGGGRTLNGETKKPFGS